MNEKTKKQYQLDSSAKKYHMTSLGKYRGRLKETLYSIYIAKYISYRERLIVNFMLKNIHPKTILDAPCGTGKLAYELTEINSQITCADISNSMISIAKEVYNIIGYKAVKFIQVDLEFASERINETFDVIVCLRLMQRLTTLKQEIILRRVL